jgi:hypothetical protein
METAVLYSVLKAVPVFASGLVAGASLYINTVEHPAREESGGESALRQFGLSARRGKVLLRVLGGTALVSGVIAGAIDPTRGRAMYFTGAGLLALTIPYSTLIVDHVTARLEEMSLLPTKYGSHEDTPVLLSTFNLHHTVRTMLALTAFSMFLVRIALPWELRPDALP